MSEINKINTLERAAFFAGSFNPFTPGHADIVERGLRLFDRVVIGIGINDAKPDSADGAASRLETIRVRYAAEPRVEVLIYTDLTVDAARRVGACPPVRSSPASPRPCYATSPATAAPFPQTSPNKPYFPKAGKDVRPQTRQRYFHGACLSMATPRLSPTRQAASPL